MSTYLPAVRLGLLACLSLAASPVRAQLRWATGAQNNLPAVSGAAIAYDAARQRIVLFGGHDVWGLAPAITLEWDGATWLARGVGTQPSPRTGARAVFDPVRGKVVLFGGAGINNTPIYGDTWEWDGQTWTQRSFVTQPAARTDFNMAWDTVRQRAVLHGGIDPAGQLLGDTWEYDGATWIPRPTLGRGPQQRARHAMAYDSARQRVVVFGGQTNVAGRPYAVDLWEWDGAGWTARVTGSLPAGRFYPEMAFDPRSGSMHVFGGEIRVQPVAEHWELSGSTWLSRGNAFGARFGHRMLYVPDQGVCAIGGFGDGSYHNTLARFDNLRWSFWPGTTGAVAAGRLASLAASNRLVHFGGTANGRLYGSTWVRAASDHEWQLLSLATGPTARAKFAMTGHPSSDQILLFGGNDGAVRNDTWLFDGVRWQAATPATVPGRRQGHALAYHPSAGGYVTFSGQGSTALWSDTLLFRDGQWSTLTPSVSPPPRAEYGLAFEGTTGGVLLFGGLGANGAQLDDTWLWDGSNWQALQPSQRPAARAGHSLTWDATRQRVVLFGGANANGELGDTWEWNGATWLLRAPAAPPVPRRDHAATYDPARGGVVIHGGQTGSPAVALDTTHWLLATNPATLAALGPSCDANTSLSAVGMPVVGAARFGFALGRAPTNAPAVLVLDNSRQVLQLGACALYVPGALLQLLGATSATGQARFDLPIPPVPQLARLQLDVQGLVWLPGGPLLGSLAATAGMRMTIGD